MKKRRNCRFFVMVSALLLLILFCCGQQMKFWDKTPHTESMPPVPSESGGSSQQISASAEASASPQSSENLGSGISSVSPASAKTSAQDSVASKSAPSDADYVRVKDYIPNIYVDLKYATNENITGHAIYNFIDAYLRYGTVKKLKQVQDELNASGYGLKIWDAYRPMEAQAELWKAKPDPRYISNPSRGPTSHNFGNTVDVTIVAANGPEIAVPTGFDDFTAKADRDYGDVTEIQREHALLLENTMIKYGFKPYSGEWWHFEDSQSYPYMEFVPYLSEENQPSD